MSYKTAQRLNKLATGLQRLADDMVNGLELVISDAMGYKRSRRQARTPRTVIYRERAPRVIYVKAKA